MHEKFCPCIENDNIPFFPINIVVQINADGYCQCEIYIALKSTALHNIWYLKITDHKKECLIIVEIAIFDCNYCYMAIC